MRDYLLCIDELTVLEELFAKKLDFYQRLRIDCDNLLRHDGSDHDPPEYCGGEVLSNRIAFTESVIGEARVRCKGLSANLKESLNTVKTQNTLVLEGDSLIWLSTALSTSLYRTK